MSHIDAHNCVESLQANAGYHTCSLKFAKLLLTLLSKHGSEVGTYHLFILEHRLLYRLSILLVVTVDLFLFCSLLTILLY